MDETKQSKNKSSNSSFNMLTLFLLIMAALLVASLSLYLALGGTKEESSYVDSAKFQAVYLNDGQVYYGKITALNSKLVSLTNVYYKQVSSQAKTTDTNTSNTNSTDPKTVPAVTLVKLGCEVHGPTDRMVINHDQVSFWENLKTDGQVTSAITTYVQNNPQGQQCPAPNSSVTITDSSGN